MLWLLVVTPALISVKTDSKMFLFFINSDPEHFIYSYGLVYYLLHNSFSDLQKQFISHSISTSALRRLIMVLNPTSSHKSNN